MGRTKTKKERDRQAAASKGYGNPNAKRRNTRNDDWGKGNNWSSNDWQSGNDWKTGGNGSNDWNTKSRWGDSKSNSGWDHKPNENWNAGSNESWNAGSNESWNAGNNESWNAGSNESWNAGSNEGWNAEGSAAVSNGQASNDPNWENYKPQSHEADSAQNAATSFAWKPPSDAEREADDVAPDGSHQDGQNGNGNDWNATSNNDWNAMGSHDWNTARSGNDWTTAQSSNDWNVKKNDWSSKNEWEKKKDGNDWNTSNNDGNAKNDWQSNDWNAETDDWDAKASGPNGATSRSAQDAKASAWNHAEIQKKTGQEKSTAGALPTLKRKDPSQYSKTKGREHTRVGDLRGGEEPKMKAADINKNTDHNREYSSIEDIRKGPGREESLLKAENVDTGRNVESIIGLRGKPLREDALPNGNQLRGGNALLGGGPKVKASEINRKVESEEVKRASQEQTAQIQKQVELEEWQESNALMKEKVSTTRQKMTQENKAQKRERRQQKERPEGEQKNIEQGRQKAIEKGFQELDGADLDAVAAAFAELDDDEGLGDEFAEIPELTDPVDDFPELAANDYDFEIAELDSNPASEVWNGDDDGEDDIAEKLNEDDDELSVIILDGEDDQASAEVIEDDNSKQNTNSNPAQGSQAWSWNNKVGSRGKGGGWGSPDEKQKNGADPWEQVSIGAEAGVGGLISDKKDDDDEDDLYEKMMKQKKDSDGAQNPNLQQTQQNQQNSRRYVSARFPLQPNHQNPFQNPFQPSQQQSKQSELDAILQQVQQTPRIMNHSPGFVQSVQQTPRQTEIDQLFQQVQQNQQDTFQQNQQNAFQQNQAQQNQHKIQNPFQQNQQNQKQNQQNEQGSGSRMWDRSQKQNMRLEDLVRPQKNQQQNQQQKNRAVPKLSFAQDEGVRDTSHMIPPGRAPGMANLQPQTPQFNPQQRNVMPFPDSMMQGQMGQQNLLQQVNSSDTSQASNLDRPIWKLEQPNNMAQVAHERELRQQHRPAWKLSDADSLYDTMMQQTQQQNHQGNPNQSEMMQRMVAQVDQESLYEATMQKKQDVSLKRPATFAEDGVSAKREKLSANTALNPNMAPPRAKSGQMEAPPEPSGEQRKGGLLKFPQPNSSSNPAGKGGDMKGNSMIGNNNPSGIGKDPSSAMGNGSQMDDSFYFGNGRQGMMGKGSQGSGMEQQAPFYGNSNSILMNDWNMGGDWNAMGGDDWNDWNPMEGGWNSATSQSAGIINPITGKPGGKGSGLQRGDVIGPPAGNGIPGGKANSPAEKGGKGAAQKDGADKGGKGAAKKGGQTITAQHPAGKGQGKKGGRGKRTDFDPKDFPDLPKPKKNKKGKVVDPFAQQRQGQMNRMSEFSDLPKELKDKIRAMQKGWKKIPNFKVQSAGNNKKSKGLKTDPKFKDTPNVDIAKWKGKSQTELKKALLQQMAAWIDRWGGCIPRDKVANPQLQALQTLIEDPKWQRKLHAIGQSQMEYFKCCKGWPLTTGLDSMCIATTKGIKAQLIPVHLTDSHHKELNPNYQVDTVTEKPKGLSGKTAMPATSPTGGMPGSSVKATGGAAGETRDDEENPLKPNEPKMEKLNVSMIRGSVLKPDGTIERRIYKSNNWFGCLHPGCSRVFVSFYGVMLHMTGSPNAVVVCEAKIQGHEMAPKIRIPRVKSKACEFYTRDIFAMLQSYTRLQDLHFAFYKKGRELLSHNMGMPLPTEEECKKAVARYLLKEVTDPHFDFHAQSIANSAEHMDALVQNLVWYNERGALVLPKESKEIIQKAGARRPKALEDDDDDFSEGELQQREDLAEELSKLPDGPPKASKKYRKKEVKEQQGGKSSKGGGASPARSVDARIDRILDGIDDCAELDGTDEEFDSDQTGDEDDSDMDSEDGQYGKSKKPAKGSKGGAKGNPRDGKGNAVGGTAGSANGANDEAPKRTKQEKKAARKAKCLDQKMKNILKLQKEKDRRRKKKDRKVLSQYLNPGDRAAAEKKYEDDTDDDVDPDDDIDAILDDDAPKENPFVADFIPENPFGSGNDELEDELEKLRAKPIHHWLEQEKKDARGAGSLLSAIQGKGKFGGTKGDMTGKETDMKSQFDKSGTSNGKNGIKDGMLGKDHGKGFAAEPENPFAILKDDKPEAEDEIPKTNAEPMHVYLAREAAERKVEQEKRELEEYRRLNPPPMTLQELQQKEHKHLGLKKKCMKVNDYGILVDVTGFTRKRMEQVGCKWTPQDGQNAKQIAELRSKLKRVTKQNISKKTETYIKNLYYGLEFSHFGFGKWAPWWHKHFSHCFATTHDDCIKEISSLEM